MICLVWGAEFRQIILCVCSSFSSGPRAQEDVEAIWRSEKSRWKKLLPHALAHEAHLFSYFFCREPKKQFWFGFLCCSQPVTWQWAHTVAWHTVRLVLAGMWCVSKAGNSDMILRPALHDTVVLIHTSRPLAAWVKMHLLLERRRSTFLDFFLACIFVFFLASRFSSVVVWPLPFCLTQRSNEAGTMCCRWYKVFWQCMRMQWISTLLPHTCKPEKGTSH